MSLSRAGVMSCDEEQVCLMIKQVQVKAISDGGYGPFSNTTVTIITFLVLVLEVSTIVYLENWHLNNLPTDPSAYLAAITSNRRSL